MPEFRLLVLNPVSWSKNLQPLVDRIAVDAEPLIALASTRGNRARSSRF